MRAKSPKVPSARGWSPLGDNAPSDSGRVWQRAGGLTWRNNRVITHREMLRPQEIVMVHASGLNCPVIRSRRLSPPTKRCFLHKTSSLPPLAQSRSRPMPQGLKTPHVGNFPVEKTLPTAPHRPFVQGAMVLAGSLLGVAVFFALPNSQVCAAEVGQDVSQAVFGQQPVRTFNDSNDTNWVSAIEFAKFAGPGVTLGLFGLSISRQLGGLEQQMSGTEKRLEQQMSGTEKRLEQQIIGLEKRLDQRIDGLGQQVNGLDRRLDDIGTEVRSLRTDVVKLGQAESYLQGVNSERRKSIS
jgi:hypothetical protein